MSSVTAAMQSWNPEKERLKCWSVEENLEKQMRVLELEPKMVLEKKRRTGERKPEPEPEPELEKEKEKEKMKMMVKESWIGERESVTKPEKEIGPVEVPGKKLR